MSPETNRDAWHRGFLLYGLCVVGVGMFAIESSIVAVALPTMVTELNTTVPLITWTLAGYTLAQVALQPAIAKLTDNFGRNRVFLICVFIFTLSSLLCAVAPNVWVLIAFRVLQAVGGSGQMPAATGIVVSSYPAHQRERLIGLFTSILPIGAILGPNLGGLILTEFSWRGIFFINIPIGLTILLLLRNRFAVDKPPAREKPIDFVGIVLFAASISSLMIALTSLGSDASALYGVQFWALLVGFVVLGWFFVRQERRAVDPMLDFGITVRRPFLQVNLYNFLYGMGLFSVMAFVPYYAETKYFMTPAQSGLLLTPRSIMMIVMSTIAAVWLLPYGYRKPMIIGVSIAVVGLLLLGLEPDNVQIGPLALSPFWQIALSMTLCGIGMGTSAPAANNSGIALLPRLAASMAALRAMIRSLGGVLGQGLVVVMMEFAPSHTIGLQHAFVAFGLLLFLCVPVVLTIPELGAVARRKERADTPAAAVLEGD